ncbi:MAG: FAD-dependent oxidoreductase [Burkholderiales bacterium]|nr:FAD-dependent oxidoreductase [Burkholderiales bacterium]
MDNRAPVAIIGGGYAGCAAAVTLASRGVRCALHEAAPVLGGRARRVERDGLPLDNGQHLMLGAYRGTLELVARVHGKERASMVRRPLAIVPFAGNQPDALTLMARRAPGRLGLLIGLVAASGLTLGERLANLAWFQAIRRGKFLRPADETVAQLLASLPPRVARLLWEPLNLAALNTPAATASAQVFTNVLREAFARRGDDCDFILPATDLSAFFPEPAARYVNAHGGTVNLDSRGQVADVGGVVCDGQRMPASAVVVAVGPHQLAHAFTPEALAADARLRNAVEALAPLAYEAICTIWLGYAERVRMPGPVARLDDAPGQWVLDRPDIVAHARGAGAPPIAQMLAVVISANGPHLAQPHDALARDVDAQLRRLVPTLPACVWSFVITEKRATYACTPARLRPAGPRLAPGVYLAGDYVNDEFPATLEAAVRSGVAAAEACHADFAR